MLTTVVIAPHDAQQSLKGQLEDKTNHLKENSADINRLQALCRELQSNRRPRTRSPRLPPTLPKQDLDAGQLAALEKALQEAQRDAAACAQIARAREEQAAEATKAQDAATRRAKDRQAELLKTTRALADAENALAATKAQHEKTLGLMKAAWNKREKEWQVHNEVREKVIMRSGQCPDLRTFYSPSQLKVCIPCSGVILRRRRWPCPLLGLLLATDYPSWKW